jgi:hypothetical protein
VHCGILNYILVCCHITIVNDSNVFINSYVNSTSNESKGDNAQIMWRFYLYELLCRYVKKMRILQVSDILILHHSLYRNRKPDQYTADLAFSIILDEEPHSLDFVAPNQRAFDYWTDGINCLLGKLLHIFYSYIHFVWMHFWNT